VPGITASRERKEDMANKTKSGWQILSALGIAAMFTMGATRMNAQTCTAADVIGTWRSQVVTDAPWDVTVDLHWRFDPNGTYSYSAGQGSFQWTAHQGRYFIRPSSGPSSRSYPCVITLNPDPGTVRINPQNRLGLMPLQARSLMADQPRSFRMQFLSFLVFQDTDLNWQDVGMFGLHRADE
jgi:hypothetical protein